MLGFYHRIRHNEKTGFLEVSFKLKKEAARKNSLFK